jgi:hypothetical protein
MCKMLDAEYLVSAPVLLSSKLPLDFSSTQIYDECQLNNDSELTHVVLGT